MNGTLISSQPRNALRLRRGLQGYESAISRAYAPMVIDPATPGQRYAWSVSEKRCGTLDLSHVYASGRIRAAIPHAAESAVKSKIILTFVVDGTFEFKQSGRHAICGPQSLALMDTAQPLEAAQQRSVELLSVIMPRDFLHARIPNLERACTVAIPAKSGGAAVLRDLVKSYWRESRSLCHADALVMPQILGSLIHSVFARTIEAGSEEPRCEKLDTFRTVIQHVIDDELRNVDLGPRLIAERLGISKSYLFVVARKLDTSVQQWIIESRLDACRAALLDPACAAQSISDIAFSTGFKDAAHFSRRFSQRFKLSPKRFRDQAVM
jgi:AraC-like DNA-binding protein